MPKKPDKEQKEKELSASQRLSSGVSSIGSFFVRIVRNAFALFTFVMIAVMFTPVANYLARPLIVDMELRSVGVIAVLGGGAYRNGILSGSSNERLLHGLRLYRSGLSEKIIFVGGSVLDQTQKITETVKRDGGEERTPDVVEAAIMMEVAKSLGFDESAMSVDNSSLNTYENLKSVKEYMSEQGFKSCLVVTSPGHMYRAIKVSKKLGMDCSPAPVGDYLRYIGSPVGRLGLMRAVLWEYAAIVLYKSFGYI
ncbi:MAG: YdcF family protein [Proteobacteria bacterium]|nr:YdcF family protein [Pseudomonadota bacterium]